MADKRRPRKREKREKRVEPPTYFRDALTAIIGKPPPMPVPPYRAMDMGDAVMELQDWCCCNANPRWATGLSMIDAAELIVQQALDNANIKKVPNG